MKKFFSAIAMMVMVMVSNPAHAQMVNKVNLQDYAKAKYGEKAEMAAMNALDECKLDANGNLVLTREVKAPNMSKGDLYVEMANWFVANYSDCLKFADKEEGVLIARPYLEHVARHAAGLTAYDVNLNPTVKCQVYDGMVKMTCTVSNYYLEKSAGNTAKGLVAAAVVGAIVDEASHAHHHEVHHAPHHDPYHYGPRHAAHHYYEYHPHHTFEDALLVACLTDAATASPARGEQCNLTDCYPFAAKDSHKKTSAKAFVMANVYSNVVLDNMQQAVRQCNDTYAMNF